jgi:hypothetical protein
MGPCPYIDFVGVQTSLHLAFVGLLSHPHVAFIGTQHAGGMFFIKGASALLIRHHVIQFGWLFAFVVITASSLSAITSPFVYPPGCA